MKGRTKHIAKIRLLYENNKSQILGINARLKIDLKILAEGFSPFQLPYPYQLLHDGDVCQTPPAIFSVHDLRFRMIESDCRVNIGIAFLRSSICADVGSKDSGGASFNTYRVNGHGDLRGLRRLQENLAGLLRIVHLQLALSIYDHLRSVRAA